MDIDKEEQKIENPIQEPIKMDILLVTSSMQNQNGIRANDFRRYSHFCRKKINKLRKLYKLTQGKRKFQKVEITPDKITDNKILLISILECERNWSYAMYHRQELTAIGEDIKRLRHQIIRKFKRASRTSKIINDTCHKIGNTQTQLESEAYYYFINSSYLISKRDFANALNYLKKASNIYERLSQLKDSIESLEYKEKINSIKTSIRFCLYNLSNSKDKVFSESDFENSINNENPEDKELLEKFEEIKKKNEQSNDIDKSNVYEIKYQGIIIPIKNEKLKDYFIQLNDINQKTDKEQELNKKIPLFQDYLNKIDEMIKTVKKEKTDDPSQKDVLKINSKIINYIENLRLKKYIDKNISYIKDYSKEFTNKEMITLLVEKENLKLRIKPQEIIKLYDNLLEYQKRLILLEKENPDQSYMVEMNFKEKAYELLKIFFSGLFYLANKKVFDAYTIMHHFQEKLKEFNDFYELNNLKNVNYLKDFYDKVHTYENLCLFIIDIAYAKIQEDKEKSNKMDIVKNKKIKYNPYLYENMVLGKNEQISQSGFEFMNDLIKINYSEYQEAINKNNYNNYNNVYQFPNNTKLLPPKPIVYDLSYEQINYPDLTEKMKKKEKGMLGRAFGYFFGS